MRIRASARLSATIGSTPVLGRGEDLSDALGIKPPSREPDRSPLYGDVRRSSQALAVLAVVVAPSGGGVLRGPGSSRAAIGTTGTDDLAVASATPTTTASPTIGMFPNDAESALLKPVPPSLADTCVRGPYYVLFGSFGAGTPLASLSCTQAIAPGANEVVVRQFKDLGLGAGNRGFTTDTAISTSRRPKAQAGRLRCDRPVRRTMAARWLGCGRHGLLLQRADR
jgi:hypothetical protein